jgi:hypothetical protein
MEVVPFFGNSIHTRLFGVIVQGHNFNTFWIENEVMKWRGVGICSFGSMLSHTAFYSNKISCNP